MLGGYPRPADRWSGMVHAMGASAMYLAILAGCAHLVHSGSWLRHERMGYYAGESRGDYGTGPGNLFHGTSVLRKVHIQPQNVTAAKRKERHNQTRSKDAEHALQRTAAGHRGCNRRTSWPPSLSLGLGRNDLCLHYFSLKWLTTYTTPASRRENRLSAATMT